MFTEEDAEHCWKNKDIDGLILGFVPLVSKLAKIFSRVYNKRYDDMASAGYYALVRASHALVNDPLKKESIKAFLIRSSKNGMFDELRGSNRGPLKGMKPNRNVEVLIVDHQLNNLEMIEILDSVVTTDDEKYLIEHLGDGDSIDEAAGKMGISCTSAYRIRKNLLRKFISCFNYLRE